MIFNKNNQVSNLTSLVPRTSCLFPYVKMQEDMGTSLEFDQNSEKDVLKIVTGTLLRNSCPFGRIKDNKIILFYFYCGCYQFPPGHWNLLKLFKFIVFGKFIIILFQ